MHTPLLDILSWLLVNDTINISVDFEQINEEESKKYQQNIDILVKYGLAQVDGEIVTPGNYLIEIESRGKNYHEKLSKAISFFFEKGYEEIESINQVIGPYLTLLSICYERSFEYGKVLPQNYSEIESEFMELYIEQR
jgi:hypothetical protein